MRRWTHRMHEYRDKAGGWRWRIVARNGRITADSGQGYSNRADMRRAVRRMMGGTFKTGES